MKCQLKQWRISENWIYSFHDVSDVGISTNEKKTVLPNFIAINSLI